MRNENIAQEKALVLVDRAYRYQMRGDFATAIDLYTRSIDVSPTAEAYTYLGWTYRMMQRYDEAIAMCEQAIAADPTFGNPYNDIGSYLMAQERWEEANVRALVEGARRASERLARSALTRRCLSARPAPRATPLNRPA